MYKLVYICLAVFLSEAAAEYDFHGLGGLGGLHGYHGLGGPLLAPSLLKAPVIPAPTIIKAIAPAPAPIYAHAPAPIYQHAPEPIYAHAPVIKAVAPATSYATVTQVHVTHPAPLVKAVVAPPPLIKTIAFPGPIAHDYPHYHH